MEYSKNRLIQFKLDYQKYGKYNLDIQVPHLVRLAEFYESKYRETKNWTDCVRAHALYNSVSTRQPRDGTERSFKLQELYWGDATAFEFSRQQELTASLKHRLEIIRNQSRDDMKTAHVLAREYDNRTKEEDNSITFINKMKSISINCSSRMADFADQVIRESVEILKPTNPPCDFEAIAIGSLARGEATPYSDLEYLFLVEDNSPETVQYFETLAITTYFLIANLGETKLSYMALNELEGWFEDKAMNGFKIDGLSAKAGNIPTGNGSSSQHNHFIVTPKELAERYLNVLHNPENETALRGDLTAMMTYMRSIFTHRNNNRDLRSELESIIQNCEVNQTRKTINLQMLNTDVRKFNFTPDVELGRKGFAADVKRELYRFPSILLLDIAVVTETASNSSWESLPALCNNKRLSAQLRSTLEFLLASATYIRLSAYLYHDSQDDRISVSLENTQNKQKTPKKSSVSQRKCFVPSRLFVPMCVKIILLRQHLAKAENIAQDLQTLALDDDCDWPRIITLFYMGRYNETLVALKQMYGNDLCEKTMCVTQNMPSGQSEFETLYIISETLYWCGEYRAALILYNHRTDNNIGDTRHRIAHCYTALGDFSKAVSILESIIYKSSHVHHSLGEAYYNRKEYKKSEQSYLQALELLYSEVSSSEKQFDYYGEPIKTDKEVEIQNGNLITITSPEERLSSIINSSPGVIVCVTLLGDVYREQGQYTLAATYYKKSLNLISELYGDGAAVHSAANTLDSLGTNYRAMGQYSEAEDYYKQAVAMYKNISRGEDSAELAKTQCNLGSYYNEIGQYNEAEIYYKQGLAMRRNLSQGTGCSDIGNTLYNLGINYQAMGQNSEAVESFTQALAGYRSLIQGRDRSAIADTLYNLGINYKAIGQYGDAVEHYKQALAIYQSLSPGTDSSEIASTLHNLGIIYKAIGQHTAADDCYKQALAIYRKLSQGADSNDIANILSNLGNNCKAMGQYSEAVVSFKQALAICRNLSQGADSSDIADTLCNLGAYYRDVGDESKAIETLTEALAMYVRVDPDNPRIIVVRESLTSLESVTSDSDRCCCIC